MNKVQVKHLRPLDPAEQNMLNTISSNLLFAGAEKKTIAVTSCHDGEGKSTIAIQLAYALAREGYAVVVADADPWGVPLLNYRGAEAEKKKIPEYLDGACTLADVVCPTDVSNLYVIPSANFFSDSFLPAGRKQFAAFTEALSKAFDFVIFDTPSAGKVIDAAKIASFCDGIVLVVQYKRTSKKDLAEVVRQLERSGSPILGSVINQVTFRSIISRKRYKLLQAPIQSRIHFGKK